MRKIFLLVTLLSMVFISYSQIKLGLKFAPVIASNRVTNDNVTNINDKSTLLMSFGLVVDKHLLDNYFISTGLIYIPKRASFSDNIGSPNKESYKIQYLQLPVTLKLFTNEVAPDMKVYFQLGTGIEFKIHDEPEEGGYVLVEKFEPLDLSILLGAGLEYKLSLDTRVFGGVSYQRGLINTLKKVSVNSAKNLMVRNTIFSIDIGIKL